MSHEATPAKLNDGTWGARTTHRVVVGSTITVRTRAGKTWRAAVNEVVWTDGTACLVRTAAGAASTAPRKSSRRHSYYGTVCRIDGTGDAWEQ